MSTTYEYFYKTGHCRPLSLAEFSALTKETTPFHDKDFIFSARRLNVERTGSLVFGGVVLYRITDYDATKLPELHEVLADSIALGRANEKFKKLGIAGPAKYFGGMLEIAKQAGAKKVNLLKDQLPNFGHWKSTNDWLVLLPQGKDLLLGEITSYTDQQFFARLDQGLPHGDMQRGIINLKLARALLNLTERSTIWDPFCGQGRVVCAGLDLKREFFASDKDVVCLPDTKANVAFAKERFSKRVKKIGTLRDAFVLDAANLDRAEFFEEISNPKELAIVTEGTLGLNVQTKLTETVAREELAKLKTLWKQVLQSAAQAGITELVFCLPWYNFKKQKILPDFVEEISASTDYEIVSLTPHQSCILYAREKTQVGHCIYKLIRT